MKKFIAIILLLTVVFMILLEVSDIGKYFFRDTISVNNGDTKMLAHRGSSWLAPENSEEAFIEAGKRSYFGIEADLRKTADGRFVMCHDSNLKELAGVDIEIENATLEQLLEIPLKDKFGRVDTKNRLTVLENYVKICKEYDKDCFLELKSSLTEDDLHNIIGIFQKFDYLHRVTFMSMDEDNLLLLRKILPDHPIQYVLGKVTEEKIQFLLENRLDASIQYLYLTKSTLKRIHDAGLKVNLWTINNKIAARVYASWGVDYITSIILE